MAARDTARFADGSTPVPKYAGMRVFPVDAEGFIDLEVLAGLHASAAKDALIWIVSIEGIGEVFLVGFGLVGNFLMFDCKQFCRVMYGAVAVVVVADGAIEQVVAEDAIECLTLG